MNILTLFGISQKDILPALATTVILATLLFLFFREIFTWYVKTTKIVSLLEKIEENTRPEISQISFETNTRQEPQSVLSKEQSKNYQRTALDKWWNGPDSEIK